MQLEDFLISDNESLLEALKKINSNKKGFVIIVDRNKKLAGTLTDGDLRRILIKQYSNNKIASPFDLSKIPLSNLYNKKPSSITVTSTLEEIVELFKSEKIAFLPVVDKGKVVNVLTKKQFQILLTTDTPISLTDKSIINLQESRLDSDIYGKPWGYYKSLFTSEHTQVKVLLVRPGEETSFQLHFRREEFWVVVKGSGRIRLELSKKNISVGDYVFVPKGCKHQITNTSNENLIMVEVQLGDYFGEDDIVRFEDKYDRPIQKVDKK